MSVGWDKSISGDEYDEKEHVFRMPGIQTNLYDYRLTGIYSIKALNEINRIVKKNGKFFVVVRSLNAWEAKLEGSSYDEETGLTKHPDLRTYGTDNVKYCYRRLHSEESIREFLEKAGFLVKHIKTYEECLSIDYDRKNMNKKASELIEVLAIK